MQKQIHNKLSFPFKKAPRSGQVIDIAPGLKWARIPLPYRLDHVNVYFVQDDDGWVLVDTGINTEAARDAWEELFDGALSEFPISKVIVTHFHPDHIGLAGWMCRRFGIPLLTSYSTYAASKMTSLDPTFEEAEQSKAFYIRYGMSAETADVVATLGHDYLHHVSELPRTFRKLLMGDSLTIGARRFRVLTADGHAPEQLLLWCPEDKLLFAADQLLEKISPNISVWAMEPDGDPLGHYMRSLRSLPDYIPDDVLVLPGHRRPFYGVHQRSRELLDHHEIRCELILKACKSEAKSVDELVPELFDAGGLSAHEMSFAFTETMAHVNRLIRRGDLSWASRDGRPVCVLG